MRTVIARQLPDLAVTAAEWNAVAGASETNSVFQTYEWFCAWWHCLGAGHELMVVRVYDGDRLVGLAPMAISTAGGERVLRFAGDSKADYLDFLAAGDKPAVLEAIFSRLYAERESWERIHLHNIPEHSSTLPLVQRLCAQHDLRHIIENNVVCPTLMIRGHEAQARQIAAKYSLRRPAKRFERMGRISFRHLSSEQEATAHLDAFFDQHVRRWGDTDSPSLFLDPRIRDFYRELVRRLLPTGWLLFSVVELDGRPISFHFGFDYNRKLIWYKPAFDVSLSRYSPGLVMLKNLVDYALAGGHDELDFTIGNEPFKERYSNKVRYNCDISIFKHPGQYYFESVLRRSRRLLKQALKGEA